MKRKLPHAWLPRLVGRLAFAMLVGAVVGWTTEGFAASVVSHQSGGEDAASHRCKCAQKCRGASCCCKHDTPKPPKPTARLAQRVVESPPVATNPCVKSAPCGDPIQPTYSSVAPIGRCALIGPALLWIASPSKRYQPASSRLEGPEQRADRLDDPPESPISG